MNKKNNLKIFLVFIFLFFIFASSNIFESSALAAKPGADLNLYAQAQVCQQGSCPSGACFVNGLCLPQTQFNQGVASSRTLSDLLIQIIKILLTFAGLIGVVMLIVGGYWYIASAGNEETSEKGKKTIINAVIGLVVVILAYSIVTIISNTLVADKLVK